jgi:hypothetical protein
MIELLFRNPDDPSYGWIIDSPGICVDSRVKFHFSDPIHKTEDNFHQHVGIKLGLPGFNCKHMDDEK